MIRRDQAIKQQFERLLSTFDDKKFFDVIFTHERPILEKITAEFQTNGNVTFRRGHAINIETTHDSQHAISSTGTTLSLTKQICALPNLTDHLEDTLQTVDNKREIAFHIVSD
jgi:hypothetical protein